MNLNVLRYVEAVAEEQNMTRAAERLYVAQPSLSQAIRALERELGTALFDRGGRVMTLTPAGERYLRWARTVLRSGDRLQAELAAAPGGLRKLTVGATPFRCRALFPEAMRRFTELRPDCRIVLRDEYQTESLTLLDEGKLDLVVDLPPAGGYVTEDVARERVLIAVRRDAPLNFLPGGDYPRVHLLELLSLPVVLIDDTRYRSPLHLGPILRRLFEAADMAPNVAVQCCGADMAHLLAAEGLGFTVVSELSVRTGARPELAYCEIEGRPLTRRFSAIMSDARPPKPDAALFIALVREAAAL